MNPYRDAFYQRQARWHRYQGPEDVAARHQHRARYYEWYTRGWLPERLDTPILDIGCGSGQFLHFLKTRGYTHALGIDLDADQVEIGRRIGLDCRREDVLDFLKGGGEEGRGVPIRYGLIVLLDILEHFTLAEGHALLEAVVDRLEEGGRLILSVPNSESPRGSFLFHADITHELSFTTLSLGQMLFCHDLEIEAFRDPWPAPIDLPRTIHRGIATVCRRLEALRFRALGLEAPAIWSPVMWALARKPAGRSNTNTNLDAANAASGPCSDRHSQPARLEATVGR
jgi:SAM-dependent methyltransferase